MISVTPSTNERIDSKKGNALSVKISVAPALALIAAAPITTQRSGVMSCGSKWRKKMREANSVTKIA